jgi:hypothetical protein
MNREALDSLDKGALIRLVLTQAETIAALNRQTGPTPFPVASDPLGSIMVVIIPVPAVVRRRHLRKGR